MENTQQYGWIYRINGPVVSVKGNKSFKMHEMVFIGEMRLIGEVIKILPDLTIVQSYESTSGLKTGEKVYITGDLLKLQLGPGLIGEIYDGILRPLKLLERENGSFIQRGANADSVSLTKKWKFDISAKRGDVLKYGDIIAETQETPHLKHRVMLPPDVQGTVEQVRKSGEYTVTDWLVKLKTPRGVVVEISALQKWAIRVPRPYKKRIEDSVPLVTGQRIIDSMFPLKKGGTAAIPGGFGTGKTVLQHQFAKWADADIIVYIGCGERGNEITQVLEEFSELTDPRTNDPLMTRTLLIANTSNMPVAAREASIYTGITISEYYRDMGYNVAIMADSTSRWAEALREISGRLEEMPAEEGYPSYLPSRIAGFYERSGYVENLNGTQGSVSIIGAVSPTGNDFSEPVTQNTKRFVRCFYALDKPLAYARHYPAVNWMDSYSEYLDTLAYWYEENIDRNFMSTRSAIMRILQKESRLMSIVKLVGADVLPDNEKLILEIAKVIRNGFLQQNSFDKTDSYVPIKKQFLMMDLILHLERQTSEVIEKNIPISQVIASGIIDRIISMKYTIDNENFSMFEKYKSEIDDVCHDLLIENEVL